MKKRAPQTIGIYGTGGGCGQSTSSVFLAKELANTGKTVCLVDLNFDKPSLHTLTSLERPKISLQHYWEQSTPLDQLIMKTDYRGLYLLAGNLSLNLNSKFESLYSKFLNDLKNTPFDYIILDLGLENQAMNLDTLCWCNKRVFVLEANPNRVETFYNIIQKLILRKIKSSPATSKHISLLKHVLIQDKNLFIEALQEIALQDAATKKEIPDILRSLSSYLLLNKVNEPAEASVIEIIRNKILNTFSIQLQNMGNIMWNEDARLNWKNHRDILDCPIDWKNQNIISLVKQDHLEAQI